MFKFNLYHLRYYNFRLIIYVALLCGSGVLFIRSATVGSGASTADKQIFGIALGMAVMLFVSLVDYHWVLKFSWLWFLIGIALLVYVLIKGTSGGWGATRWIIVPFLGTFQPSELYKIIMIVFFAFFFNAFAERINSVFVLLAAAVLFGLPLFLVFKEPDLSTSLVLTAIFLIMLYVAKISYKWILGAVAVVIPVGVWVIYTILQEGQTLIEEFQRRRILTFLYPDRYSPDMTQQTNYSVIAIASGMLRGKGLNNTTLESVKNGKFLSESDTDFIFAIIGEETGFIGSMAIIGLLFLVVAECIYVGVRTKDLGGKLVCMGVASWIALQTFVNISVTTDILPNTGLTLPFVSAGLTSLISLCIGIGVVLNIGLQRQKNDNFKMGVIR
ncbi:MAG: rod shape-determining protein RodA [Lachnospiraceae bacterium]|nr:rod shape-determining protein RodA [Lachnospiraceae bacterium]